MAGFIFVIWIFTSIAALVGFIAPKVFRVKKRVFIVLVYIGSSFVAIIGIGTFHESQPEQKATASAPSRQQKYPYQAYDYIDSISCTLLVKGSTNPWDSTAPITESNAYPSYDSLAAEDACFTIPPNTKVLSSARYTLLINTDTIRVQYYVEHEGKTGWIFQKEVEELK